MNFDPGTAVPAEAFDPSTAVPEETPPTRAVLQQVVKAKPDTAAEVERLAKRYPAPYEVIERNVDDFQMFDAAEGAAERLRSAPLLEGAIRRDARLGKLAHDDIEPLAKIESNFAKVAAASVGQAVLGVSEGIWRTPDATQRAVGYLAGTVEKTGLPRYLNPIRGVQDAIRFISEGRVPGVGAIGGTTNIGEQVNSAQKILAEDPTTFGMAFKDIQTLGQNADRALQTAIQTGNLQQMGRVITDPNYWSAFLAQAVPSLYMVMKSGGSVAFMGWLEGMEQAGNAAEFEQKTGQKISDADFTQAVAQTAIVNALLEKFGLDKVLGAKGNGLMGLAKAMAGEGGTEGLQQLNSNLAAQLAYDGGKSLSEGVLASIMGGVGAGGGVSAVQAATAQVQQMAEKHGQQADAAQRHADALAEQLKLAGSALLRERSPEQFRALMATMTDGKIYIDGGVLNQLPLELLQQLPEQVWSEVSAAAATGGTVEIPVADALTVAPGTPLEQVLVEHARTDPTAMSQAEAAAASEQAQVFLQQEAERVIQQAADSEAMRASAEVVRTTIRDEIIATGRYRAAVAEGMSQWASAFYTTMAARTGMTPEQFYAKHRLRILGAPTGQDQVLNDNRQEGLEVEGYHFSTAETSAFKTWFGDSKVVDAQGKPLVVYHGTGKDFDVFKPKKKRLDDNSYARDGYVGMFFAASPDSAEYFAGGDAPRVMPVYLSLQNPLVFDMLGQQKQPGVVIAAAERAKASGHDGLILLNMRDAGTTGPDHVLVAFRPEQIKSAIGNRGTFDPADPNILNQGPRGTFNPRTLELVLNENANLSTFFHETGHFFLEVLADIASQPDAPAQIVEDMNAFLKWAGVKDLETWSALDLEGKRKYHERWAESIEQYVMEGKAPSVELQPLMRRFATWLKSVYGSIKQFLAARGAQAAHGPVLGQPGTSAFEKWFGGSKVVDAQGKPLVVYHGTKAEFTEFKRTKSGEFGPAIYMTDSPREASEYGDGKGWGGPSGTAVMPLYVSIKNPYTKGVDAFWKEFGAADSDAAALDRAQAAGYDGIIAKRPDRYYDNEAREFVDRGGELTHYIAFRPEQIKSAIGNRGAYDPADPNILNQGTQPAGPEMALNDDIRRVMDRMLATDEQIAQANEVAGLLPNEDADATAAERLRKRSMADLKWAVKARDAVIAKMQKEAKVIEASIRQRVTEEVDAMPVYLAKDAVERAVKETDADPVAADAKLDSIASQYGYTSIDHMVREIENAQPKAEVIDGLTEQRMLEEHGDLIDERAIQQAANEAVHNENRARSLATELRTQSEMLNARTDTGETNRKGSKITVNVLVEAARQFGANIVARTRILDLKTKAWQHTAAERRAGKAWQKATAAGKTAEAVKAKQDQVLNNAAAKAALEADAEARKLLEYLKKFDKASVREKLPPEYLDQIDKLLERVDLRASTTGRDIDRRASLAKWIESQHALGLDPVLPENLLEDIKLKSYKEMTFDEFVELTESIKNIEHLGRLKSKLLAAKDKREFDAIANEWADSIRANGGVPRPVQLEPDGRVKAFFKGAWAEHRKINSLIRQMDGGEAGGPGFRFLIQSMNERGTQEDVALEKATMALAEIFAPLDKLPGGLSGDKRFIPEINNSLSRAGRLAIALNWGNAQNRQRVMDGDGWTEPQVNAILATLTPVELQFVNQVWEHIDSYWPEVKAKQLRVSGVVEDKVEAELFEINGVRMRGGYYPIKYDPDRSIRAQINEAKEIAADMLRGAVLRPTTRRGHTKARVAEVKGRPIRKDLAPITQHVSQVVHDLAWHEWAVDANRLLADPRISAAIREHHGAEIHRAMTESVEAIVVGDLAKQTAIDRLLLQMRANVTRSIMGVSATTALLQPFGLTQSMARIGVVPVLKGAARWAGDAAKMESTVEWIHGKSEFMRLRAKTFNRELREINQTIQGKWKATKVLDAVLFYPMQKMQMIADVPTWVGMYEKALAEGRDEGTAVSLADEAVLSSQGGGGTKDLAGVQRNLPFLTQFYSYFSTTLNLVAEKTALTDFKNPRAVAGWAGDMALLAMIPAILPALITYLLKGGGDDDEPKDIAKKLVEWQASYLLGMFVGLRELPTLWSPFDYGGPPAAKLLNDGKRLVQQAGQGEIDDPAVVAAIGFLGTALGLPTTQIIRSYKGWKAWDDGDAPPTSILFGPPPKN